MLGDKDETRGTSCSAARGTHCVLLTHPCIRSPVLLSFGVLVETTSGAPSRQAVPLAHEIPLTDFSALLLSFAPMSTLPCASPCRCSVEGILGQL